jgi:hypothetical protein
MLVDLLPVLVAAWENKQCVIRVECTTNIEEHILLSPFCRGHHRLGKPECSDIVEELKIFILSKSCIVGYDEGAFHNSVEGCEKYPPSSKGFVGTMLFEFLDSNPSREAKYVKVSPTMVGATSH